MILAVSRFRVKNELGDAVRQAFRDRPRRVEGAPGYLGMETFTDGDTFYLTSRWRDEASFRAWHHSPAHGKSHEGIPKGLKLDPKATRLLVLEPIEESSPVGQLEGLLRGSIPRLARLFDHALSLHLLTTDAEGIVQWCSRSLQQRIEALGRPLAEIIIGDHGVEDALEAEDPVALHFASPLGASFSVLALAQPFGEGLLLMAEQRLDREARYQESLVELNNELATLSRDNLRKSRELQRALADLRQAEAALVHREKLAALGQMTAGVAHEINSPLGWVSANNESLELDFADVLGALEAAREQLPHLEATAPQAAKALRAAIGSEQVDETVAGIRSALGSSKKGLARIAHLVEDLRRSTRIDEASVKAVDLHASIGAALRFISPLARTRNVEVELQPASLPPCLCAPAAVNQVVLNLVTNAIHASPPGAKVAVRLGCDGGGHWIEVIDAGTGAWTRRCSAGRRTPSSRPSRWARGRASAWPSQPRSCAPMAAS